MNKEAMPHMHDLKTKHQTWKGKEMRSQIKVGFLIVSLLTSVLVSIESSGLGDELSLDIADCGKRCPECTRVCVVQKRTMLARSTNASKATNGKRIESKRNLLQCGVGASKTPSHWQKASRVSSFPGISFCA
jgi:hypothetical protein